MSSLIDSNVDPTEYFEVLAKLGEGSEEDRQRERMYICVCEKLEGNECHQIEEGSNHTNTKCICS